MKALFIDDEEDSVIGIMDHVRDKGDWLVELSSFKDAPGKLMTFNPDLVVLDWMDGLDPDRSDEGAPILDAIYNYHFVPIIVFSGKTSRLSDEVKSIAYDNPMVEFYSKGDEGDVKNKIDQWEPYIRALSTSKNEINQSLLISAKAIAYYFELGDIEDNVIRYMLRRRMHDSITEDFGEGDNPPPAWCEYEYPPMSNSILVADVLRINDGDNGSVAGPEKYYVVLTPSCDMARAKEDKSILVAACDSKERVLNGESVTYRDDKEKEALLKRVRNVINTGYNYANVPVPELPGKIPYMTINLKKLSFISLGRIALNEKEADGKDYYRVASFSSPFREGVVWAHMVNSCRPGLPDRDVTAWGENLIRKK